MALYVKSNLDCTSRLDLGVTEQEYETVWTEIKNPKSKSILCCCTYRHPNTDISKLTKYLSFCLSKIKSEDKLVFIMGDFNINLLNYDSHTDTSKVLDQMVSRYILPYVLHPTRVKDHCATVTDNIFSNNTEFETLSGNILTQIADHFPHIMIL